METTLIYIGKSAIAAAAFYLAFLLLFQNQKHFRFNRIYLPVSLALSFGIPLITFTTVKYMEPVKFDANSFATLAPASGEIIQPAFVLEWYHYLFGLYLLGTAGFLFHLVLGHLKAISIIRKSRTQKLFDALINITIKDVHPFSFFSKIVISENTLDHPNLKMIVEHENIHVKEKHTLDILFAEILFLFQWFNPFVWLIKDAMKNNLEYLTDHQITQNNNAKDYQLAMVTLADKKGVAPFLNALNGNQLKNRIIMMKKKTENKYSFVKQLLILPLLAVLVMGLSNREVKTEVIQNSNQNEISSSEKIIKGNVTDQKGDPISGASVIAKGTTTGTITDPFGNYEFQINNENETLSFLVPDFETVNIDINGQNIIDLQLKSDNSSNNSVVKVTTSGTHNFTLEKENKYIVSGKVRNEKDEPLSGVSVVEKGKMTGTSTDTKGNYEIRSEVEIETLLFGKDGYEMMEVKTNGRKNIDVKLEVDNKLYIVDGKEYEGKTDEIDTDNIGRIDVLKGESGFKLYGDKGKNGVVLIFTKATNNQGDPIFYKVDTLPEFPGGETALRNFLASEIKYPEIASENGIQGKVYVSFIVTKEGKVTEPSILRGVDPALDKEALRVVSSFPDWKPGKQNGKPVNVSYTVPITFGSPEKIEIPKGLEPLFVVDGIEKDNIEYLGTEEIESISVLKDESATSIFGKKGKNGVIIVTTKGAEVISSELDLRKFIAKRVKYPMSVQEKNIRGKIKIYAEVNSMGIVTSVSEKQAKEFEILDEVVITSYAPTNDSEEKIDNQSEALTLEAKRVVQILPKIEIPELKGKTVEFTFNFTLQ